MKFDKIKNLGYVWICISHSAYKLLESMELVANDNRALDPWSWLLCQAIASCYISIQPKTNKIAFIWIYTVKLEQLVFTMW